MNARTGTPRRRPPIALVVGMDIEEVYSVFGEGIQLATRGLAPAHYDMIEAKARRVVLGLLDLGVPAQLVQAIEEVAGHIQRSGDPLPDGIDLAGFRDRSFEDGNSLSLLMDQVRNVLTEPQRALYDVGVMLTRLHLCLRVLVNVTDTDDPDIAYRLELYQVELTRVAPLVREMIGTLLGIADARQMLDERLDERLGELLAHLDAWDGGSAAWSSEALRRLAGVFDLMGAIGRRPRLAATGEAPAPMEQDPLAALAERWEGLQQRLEELADARAAEAAEAEVREFLGECRSALGPGHPLTLAVKAQECLALLWIKRPDLAVDLAYDLADEGERWFGPRHPNAVRLQCHALFVLIEARQFREALEFQRAKLDWLAQADPATLDPAYRDQQEGLFELMGRRRPLWRRRRR